ncbi:MAG: hypothetical protein KDF64_16695 [Geminicoccaceae bacterium]|nr:hypothetical protein [Geminicoccaceae bacterium]
MSTRRTYCEVEVAFILGYRRWRDFERGRKDGFVPSPDIMMNDGERWSDVSIDRLLNPDGEMIDSAVRVKKLEQRIDSGENAPIPRQGKRRR